MKKNEYKCAMCGGVFDKGWTDEKAEKELLDNFNGTVATEECDLVCDDCYNKLFNNKSKPYNEVEEEHPEVSDADMIEILSIFVNHLKSFFK